MRIEILGTGCPKCRMLEENTRKAVKESGIEAEIIKVSDIDKILTYDVMTTPALVIDGKIRCHGRIADVPEIAKFIRQG